MTTRILRPALAIAFLLTAVPALAQREGYSYLSWVGTEVTLVSSAEDDSTARPNTPILVGDRITTGSSSRAEAILADGNVLRIDVGSDLRFDRLARTYESEDDRNSIYLERGGIHLEHRWSTSRDEATRIDTGDVTVLFPDKGYLRIEAGRRGTEVYVVSGRAEIASRSGRATLRAGQYAFATGDSELEIDWLGEPRDRFAAFVSDRRSFSEDRSTSDDVTTGYEYDYAVADFDRHGSWITVGGSRAWRPTVSIGWRPYTDGYWRWSPVGLTWVSYEPWGWLPYHYGSWGWDVGFGWYWTPGLRYSPAWVYWSYTPSWVGWCPIGYYGSYYGSHYGSYANRSHRNRRGSERWTHAYPHLRGRIDMGRIDPRGWSYTSVNRLGSRFDARRDVLGHESVRFQPGERGLVVTTPLRIERGRGGSVTTVVQDAVRRVPRTLDAAPRGGGGLDDLTPVLRRDGTLGSAQADGLRRAWVTAGEDRSYRPVPADQLAAPRRSSGSSATAATAPSRGSERGLGASSSPARDAGGSVPSRDSSTRSGEGWRDTGTRSGAASGTARHDVEPPLRGGFGNRDVRGDDGWRSPGGETRPGSTPSRTFDVPARRAAPPADSSEAPARTGTRASAPRSEPWRVTEPSRGGDAPARPRDSEPAPAPRRSAPAPRADEGWRGNDTPRSAPAPRTEAPPSRSYQTPSRGYEAPPRSSSPSRSAPAPRYEAPPSRSYQPPTRGYEAPS
ncbi:MAG: DUF6600 domain-containing protein, partial [Thermoanaerobaculia bacterium]